ncbi:SufD family Fe-S cluster assembly protein [Oscillospiraceae bacterium OttesenSCG-928-F05]|nr:SufD family Fe-S cluster assembly protein [Oscillospiraceae bacterium OttesenSCG-928-F05]
MSVSKVVENLLETVSDLTGTPKGAHNIRVNGKSAGFASSENVEIRFKDNGAGLEVHVKPGTKYESVHIPAIIEGSGFTEEVYNDFFIGEESDIVIIAGCGIHNPDHELSRHDGIHTFHVGKNAKVKYLEKHYGSGEGTGKKVLNPVTKVRLEKGSYLEMDTVQIEGVDNTTRVTEGVVGDGATLVVKEKLMTSGGQKASTEFNVELDGEQSGVHLVSRSVAKGNSVQVFLSKINGNNACTGHSECDAIIMDNASVRAIPEITANHVDASLIHEAAIGKIAGEQIIKLMTLGLTREEAEEQIVNGFLK